MALQVAIHVLMEHVKALSMIEINAFLGLSRNPRAHGTREGSLVTLAKRRRLSQSTCSWNT